MLLLKDMVLWPLNRISLMRYFFVRCGLARENKLYSHFRACLLFNRWKLNEKFTLLAKFLEAGEVMKRKYFIFSAYDIHLY